MMMMMNRKPRRSNDQPPCARRGGISSSLALRCLGERSCRYRMAFVLGCLYLACLLHAFWLMTSLQQYDEHRSQRYDIHHHNNHERSVSSSPFTSLLQNINLESSMLQALILSPTPESIVAAALTKVNSFQEPRVDDWYKETLRQMEINATLIDTNTTTRTNTMRSCRRVSTSTSSSNGISGEDFYYYSIDPLAACRTTTTTTTSRKKLIYYNPHDRPRILCGQTIAAHGGTVEFDEEESCLEPSRLWSVIPSLETASQLPPTVLRFNDPNQKAKNIKPFEEDSCDVPCHSGGYRSIVSTRTVDGTPFVIHFSMEGPQYYPKQLQMQDYDYQDNIFYSISSFRSEIPLPYYSETEYNIQGPAVDFHDAEKSAVFMARNCGSKSKREAWIKGLIKSGLIRVDSLSTCLHNANPPAGIDGLGNKHKIMQRYLFYLAFENQREHDYVTEKLWGAYAAGTIPVYLGAPNIKSLVPHHHSYIDVDDFETPYDLAEYLHQVANNQTLYESYHVWRREPLSVSFISKFNITRTHSTCRTCRWAYAKMYGLGWSHKDQSIRDDLQSTVSRGVCLDNTNPTSGTGNSNGLIMRPFREVWIDAVTHQQVVPDENDARRASTTTSSSSCQEVNPQTRTISLDHGRLRRTIWEQDGVVDVVLEYDYPIADDDDDKSFERTNATRKTSRHVPPRRKLQLRLDTPLEEPVELSYLREGQVRFQNHHLRLTLLTWPTRVAHITQHATNNGSGSLVLDLHKVTATASTFPLRLRFILEDVDLFHKDADQMENYFASLMMDDFFHPVEAFYQEDETTDKSDEE